MSADTFVTPSGVAMVNPPMIDGATLSSWASPETTASPLAAMGTSSSREWPRSYSRLSATAAAARAGGRGAEARRRTDALCLSGCARARPEPSATAPTVFFSGSSGMNWLPAPVTSMVVRSAFSTRTTSAGRSRATPNTSKPLPRLALVAGARTVSIPRSFPQCRQKVADRGGPPTARIVATTGWLVRRMWLPRQSQA